MSDWWDVTSWDSGDFSNVLGTAGSIGSIAMSLWGDDGSSSNVNAATSGLNSLAANSETMNKIAKEQWERYKQIYDDVERKRADEELKDYDLMRPLKVATVDEQLHNISAYRGLEDAFINESMQGLDPEQFARQAGADVASSFDKNAQVATRNAKRSGSFNPNSGAYGKLQHDLGLSRALAGAGARTNARRTAKDYNLALKGNALNARRGLPSVSQTNAGSGTGLLSSAASNLSSAAQGFGNVAAGQTGLANLAGQNYQTKLGNIGAGLGMGLGVLQNNADQQFRQSVLDKLG